MLQKLETNKRIFENLYEYNIHNLVKIKETKNRSRCLLTGLPVSVKTFIQGPDTIMTGRIDPFMNQYHI